MQREDRYLVIKRTDMEEIEENFTKEAIKTFNEVCEAVMLARDDRGALPLSCVVVEADWPMYESTWAEIARWVDGTAAQSGGRCNTFGLLREVNTRRAVEWGGADTSTETGFLIELLFRSNELGGECGEAQNEAKKLARSYLGMPGGKDSAEAEEALANEIADTIICCDRLAELFDIDLAAAVARKFNKTSDKHGFETKF